MADYAHDRTDLTIEEIEKELRKIYGDAEKDLHRKCEDYFRRFKIKDAKKRDQLKRGVITQEDYDAWRASQIFNGQRWEALKERVAGDMYNANSIAKAIIAGHRAEVYALNHNFATYMIEKGAKVNTSYTLYNTEAIERMLKKNPQMLPFPGKNKMKEIIEKKDKLWNQKVVQSVAQQGIIQGESIPQITKRIEKTLGESNHKAAIRNARTLMTGAENGGREDAYKRAQGLGIKLKQAWIATLDMRTRHEHRELDGMAVGVDEDFIVPSSGEHIKFPGDPTAPGHLVYNCRCRTIAQIEGFERDTTALRGDPDIEDMTYEQWTQSRKEKPNPIDLPEKKRQAAIARAIKEYQK